MDCVVHGVAKSQTQLSDFHFHPNSYIEVLTLSTSECDCIGCRTFKEVKILRPPFGVLIQWLVPLWEAKGRSHRRNQVCWHLDLGLQPPEPRENECLFVTQPVVPCYGSPSNLTRLANPLLSDVPHLFGNYSCLLFWQPLLWMSWREIQSLEWVR